jgi:hypothetical protein
MWDMAKNPCSRRTSFFTRSHDMKGNGTKGKTLQGGKAQTIPRLKVQTKRELCQKGGSF